MWPANGHKGHRRDEVAAWIYSNQKLIKVDEGQRVQPTGNGTAALILDNQDNLVAIVALSPNTWVVVGQKPKPEGLGS
jgi:hypothetical protein